MTALQSGYMRCQVCTGIHVQSSELTVGSAKHSTPLLDLQHPSVFSMFVLHHQAKIAASRKGRLLNSKGGESRYERKRSISRSAGASRAQLRFWCFPASILGHAVFLVRPGPIRGALAWQFAHATNTFLLLGRRNHPALATPFTSFHRVRSSMGDTEGVLSENIM